MLYAIITYLLGAKRYPVRRPDVIENEVRNNKLKSIFVINMFNMLFITIMPHIPANTPEVAAK